MTEFTRNPPLDKRGLGGLLRLAGIEGLKVLILRPFGKM
jgi:hypothetical protein